MDEFNVEKAVYGEEKIDSSGIELAKNTFLRPVISKVVINLFVRLFLIQ